MWIDIQDDSRRSSSAVWQLNVMTGFIEQGHFCWPDGFWVDVDRGDPLQQKLHHFQERVGGLFWECQLPCDLPLHTVKRDIMMDTHRLQGLATCLHTNILSNYLKPSTPDTHARTQQLLHTMQIWTLVCVIFPYPNTTMFVWLNMRDLLHWSFLNICLFCSVFQLRANDTWILDFHAEKLESSFCILNKKKHNLRPEILTVRAKFVSQ